MNGLVRQFLPKGMDLSTVTPQALAYIERILNDRPRKVLGFRTPREVYTGSSSFRVDCHNVIVQPPERMETAVNA